MVFVPAASADEVLGHAVAIRATEGAQADRIRSGTSLRAQVQFERYLADRAANPSNHRT